MSDSDCPEVVPKSAEGDHCMLQKPVFELEHSMFVHPCYQHKLCLGLHSQCVYRCRWAALLDRVRWRLVLGAPDHERRDRSRVGSGS